MGKLEVIDGKQTNWNGLWWHPEYNGYSSACIDISQLRKFKGKVRCYVRKNKYYEKGENNRPNYNFCFKDADSDTFSTLEVIDDSKCASWEWTEKLSGFTILEGYTCSNCGYPFGNHTTRYCPECGSKMLNGESEYFE